MRRLAILLMPLLLVAFVFGAIGCGGEETKPAPTPTQYLTATPTPTTTPTPTPTPEPTPRFESNPLTISPTEAVCGQQVTITTTVRNLGGTGTYQAELEINGAVVEGKDVMVPGGDSRAVTFYVTKDEPGTFQVMLGGRRGSFTVSNPPLNVALDYVAVKSDHNVSGPGEIYLIVLVDDGKQQQQFSLPPEGTWQISDYETKLAQENLFSTGSVGDYFRVVVLAYHRIDPGLSIGGLLEVLGGFTANPYIAGAGALISYLEEQAPEYEYVGYYQNTWSEYNSWGLGRYDAVGKDDLRLWFRIWSNSPQQPVSQPSMGFPNVVIQSVQVPAEVEVGVSYPYSVTLRNNESHSTSVRLDIHSSVTGLVSSESVTVPQNDTKVVDKTTRFEPAGVRTVTYTILFNGHILDSVPKTVTARERQLSVYFDGWYVGGLKVDTTTKDKTVTARIRLSGWDPGQYTMRIIRDITLWPDESVTQTSFYYDSGLVTKELAFIPPLATGGSTRGYHVDLLRDGQAVWSQPSSYPPRLIVSNP